MANASGLRPGSQVLLGGVAVGTVGNLDLTRGINGVIAQSGPRTGARSISARACTRASSPRTCSARSTWRCSPGDAGRPLPSGSTLPRVRDDGPDRSRSDRRRARQPTRARLAILLDEAGIAVAGRQRDVSAILPSSRCRCRPRRSCWTRWCRTTTRSRIAVPSSDGFIAQIEPAERRPEAA